MLIKNIRRDKANDVETKKSMIKPGNGMTNTANTAITVRTALKSLSLMFFIVALLLHLSN